ncbi:MAG: ABC transporter substrate-binding protein [Oscillospiraceae bacterium]|jgi:iron complex transport system substrate-binding protein|nr:ABC transporter substrate-binding protein [Oscillospiraceae bacterium]
MRKHISLLLALVLLCTAFVACDKGTIDPADDPANVIVDNRGVTLHAADFKRVVCAYASYSDLWLKAGGKLVGVTDDVEERGIDAGKAKLIGSVKTPSLEKIVDLKPDFVILSADIDGQIALDEQLTALKIPHGYFTADTFPQYGQLAEKFLKLTGNVNNADLWNALVRAPSDQILAANEKTKDKKAPSVLLLRVTSTDFKVKRTGTVAASILDDLGVNNIADSDKKLLETLSVEKIVQLQPDWILLDVMGIDETQAQESFDKLRKDQPAWDSLSAVKDGKVKVLPKDLFHYKPNERWGESYAFLADVLF